MKGFFETNILNCIIYKNLQNLPLSANIYRSRIWFLSRSIVILHISKCNLKLFNRAVEIHKKYPVRLNTNAEKMRRIFFDGIPLNLAFVI